MPQDELKITPQDPAAKLSHYDAAGEARMVDVSGKSATRREATASAFVTLSPAVLAALPSNPKGNPLEVARFAGNRQPSARPTSSPCVTRSRSRL